VDEVIKGTPTAVPSAGQAHTHPRELYRSRTPAMSYCHEEFSPSSEEQSETGGV
jgi:hypothetical protein